jgi:hypothetical protein
VYLLHALAAMVVIGALFAAAFLPMIAAGTLGDRHGSEAVAALRYRAVRQGLSHEVGSVTRFGTKGRRFLATL